MFSFELQYRANVTSFLEQKTTKLASGIKKERGHMGIGEVQLLKTADFSNFFLWNKRTRFMAIIKFISHG